MALRTPAFPADLDLPPPHPVPGLAERQVTTRATVFGIHLLTEIGPEGAKLLVVDDLCTFTVSAEVLTAAEMAACPNLDAARYLAGERMGAVFPEVMAVAMHRAMARPAMSGPISAVLGDRVVMIHLDPDEGAVVNEDQAANLSRFVRDMAIRGTTGNHELVGFDDLDHPIVMKVDPVGPPPLSDLLDGFDA